MSELSLVISSDSFWCRELPCGWLPSAEVHNFFGPRAAVYYF